MDPNEALRLIREAIERLRRAQGQEEGEQRESEAANELAELVEGLDGWLTKGGFLPQAWERCQHSWIAGMMYVHAEDVEQVAKARAAFGETVECEKCEKVYQVD